VRFSRESALIFVLIIQILETFYGQGRFPRLKNEVRFGKEEEQVRVVKTRAMKRKKRTEVENVRATPHLSAQKCPA